MRLFRSILLLFSLMVPGLLQATEGMWIPMLLKSLNEAEMQSMGLKLSAEDIYAVNKSSLKDAIVHFGGGCTAEVVSSKGLIFTNHHCGFSQIQSHSSVEKDYLTHGFWAMKQEEELPNPGLTATLIVRIEDVTERVMQGGSPADAATIERNIAKIKSEIKANEKNHEAEVKPFFYGNAYYLIVTKTYRDVRLVGAPPGGVGKFGGIRTTGCGHVTRGIFPFSAFTPEKTTSLQNTALKMFLTNPPITFP
jgi:hypothetical protein